jgi:DNA-binding CsgD family transcriptional regulator
MRTEAGNSHGRQALTAQALGIAKRNWVTVIGLICVLYIWAALCSAQLNGMYMATAPDVFGYVGAALGALLAALLFCGFLILGHGDLLDTLELALPPVCVTTLVLARFLGDWSGGLPTLFSNAPLGFSTSVLGIMAFIDMRREVASGAAPLLVVGGSVVLFGGFFLSLLLAWPHMTDGLADSISISLLVLFVGGVAVWLVLQLHRLARPLSGGEGFVDDGEGAFGETEVQNLEAICNSLAQTYDLSPREHEVLQLLAQGRGVPYISEKICVSGNTAKTHVKRIYQKCNVHSKEELIDLIRG